MYVAGFAAGWFGARRRARRPGSPMTPEQVDDLVFYIMVGVIVGGRLGYMLLYDFANLVGDPISLFYITRGGMSFHGGLIGVLVAFWLFARRKLGSGFFSVADFVAPYTAPGLGFGRLGNFINGELWGRQTDPAAPWAVLVREVDPQTQATVLVPRHASQLYEAVLEGIVLFLILWSFSRKPRPARAVSGLFLLCYGVFRCAVEFIRMPDNGQYFALGWITYGQLYSVPMIVAGAVLLALAYLRREALAA